MTSPLDIAKECEAYIRDLGSTWIEFDHAQLTEFVDRIRAEPMPGGLKIEDRGQQIAYNTGLQHGHADAMERAAVKLDEMHEAQKDSATAHNYFRVAAAAIRAQAK